MIRIVKHEAPPMKMPTFSVDGALSDRLNDYELTKTINKSSFLLFLGKAGSGKTSLIVSFLNSPHLFKSIFHNIFLFMGKNSRDSIKGNFFDKEIPPECIFDELTIENLDYVYEQIKADSEEGYRSLIICDDCQKYLKDKDVEKQLLHIVNNRRHLKTSIWLANQNYRLLPKQTRMGLTGLFVFKVSKPEMQNIFDEQIELNKDKFDAIQSVLFPKPHDFVFIDPSSQRLFSNFDEIIVSE